MASLEDRATALEAEMAFVRQQNEVITVVRQTSRGALAAIADLGEQVDSLESKVDRLESKVDTLHEKVDVHTTLLHRILKRLGEEE